MLADLVDHEHDASDRAETHHGTEREPQLEEQWNLGELRKIEIGMGHGESS